MVEYDCVDCGVHVYAFGLEATSKPPFQCMTCLWIETYVKPSDKPTIRKLLAVSNLETKQPRD